MDKESDVIKHQMEHTRAALTDKLELLENQVADTVSGAVESVERVRQSVTDTVSGAAESVSNIKHAFEDTVASVKETVRETAETVGETLDLRKQTEKHPWAMMAGATAVGFGIGVLSSRVDVREAASSAAGSVASSAKSLASRWTGREGEEGEHVSSWTGPPPSIFEQRRQRGEDGRRQREESREEAPWAPAVNQLKGLAIGAMFGVLRDMLAKSMPDTLRGQVGDVIDNFTTSLGGKPIAGRVLPDSWNRPSPEEEMGPTAAGTSWQAKEREWRGGSPRPRQTAMADIEE
jgi:ElaB/YqjD/DUF883 family membrane-anchored ribosome-binding protein